MHFLPEFGKDFDFSKINKGLENKINALKNKLNSEHQSPVFDFTASVNTDNIVGEEAQKKFLSHLQIVADNLTKSSKKIKKETT